MITAAGRALYLMALTGLAGCLAAAPATALTIQLPGTVEVSRKVVRYACDSNAAKLGVPAGSFAVEYINGGGNSLAVVPIAGQSLIFANVISGSGARYTARQFTWWEARGSVTLSSIEEKTGTTCRPVAP